MSAREPSVASAASAAVVRQMNERLLRKISQLTVNDRDGRFAASGLAVAAMHGSHIDGVCRSDRHGFGPLDPFLHSRIDASLDRLVELDRPVARCADRVGGKAAELQRYRRPGSGDAPAKQPVFLPAAQTMTQSPATSASEYLPSGSASMRAGLRFKALFISTSSQSRRSNDDTNNDTSGGPNRHKMARNGRVSGWT